MSYFLVELLNDNKVDQIWQAFCWMLFYKIFHKILWILWEHLSQILYFFQVNFGISSSMFQLPDFFLLSAVVYLFLYSWPVPLTRVDLMRILFPCDRRSHFGSFPRRWRNFRNLFPYVNLGQRHGWYRLLLRYKY